MHSPKLLLGMSLGHKWTTDSSGVLLYSALIYHVIANNSLYTRDCVYIDLT